MNTGSTTIIGLLPTVHYRPNRSQL
jgi:hypothetical protein